MQTRDELRTIVTEDLSLSDVHFIINHKLIDSIDQLNFFDLLSDEDDKVAYRAAWVMTHFSDDMRIFFQDKTEILVTELLKSDHRGKRRLILSIIHKNKLGIAPISIQLLNHCLEQMSSLIEPPGIRSLCVKIAYDLCLKNPDLLQEFRLILDSMEEETSPAIQSVVRNTQKRINRKIIILSLSSHDRGE